MREAKNIIAEQLYNNTLPERLWSEIDDKEKQSFQDDADQIIRCLKKEGYGLHMLHVRIWDKERDRT